MFPLMFIFFLFQAYLSLPHGTASAAGLIAMMTDHYSNLVRTTFNSIIKIPSNQ